MVHILPANNCGVARRVGGDIKTIASKDGGETWTAPRTILSYNASSPYFGAAKVTANKVASVRIAGNRSTWLLPFWQEVPKNSANDTNTTNCAGVLSSVDHGQTWTPYGCVSNHCTVNPMQPLLHCSPHVLKHVCDIGSTAI